MSVRIRLARVGRKKIPHYRIVVMDSRDRRDGAFIDQIGTYDPKCHPAKVLIRETKALQWLAKGALPSETVRNLFSEQGIMLRHHLEKKETPPEKMEEALSQWKDGAMKRSAKSAANPTKRKAKSSSGSSAAETAPAA